MAEQKSQKGANDIIMKRKIYQQLLDWKEKRNGEVALLVEGARRIGKSYIAEEFARNEYESYKTYTEKLMIIRDNSCLKKNMYS